MKEHYMNKERRGSWPGGRGTVQRSQQWHKSAASQKRCRVQWTLQKRLGCQINIYILLF